MKLLSSKVEISGKSEVKELISRLRTVGVGGEVELPNLIPALDGKTIGKVLVASQVGEEDGLDFWVIELLFCTVPMGQFKITEKGPVLHLEVVDEYKGFEG